MQFLSSRQVVAAYVDLMETVRGVVNVKIVTAEALAGTPTLILILIFHPYSVHTLAIL